MTNDFAKPPKALLSRIAQDLKPVKPSPLPSRLLLRIAPLAVVASSLILAAAGIRHDAALGPVLTWGASLAQLCVAAALAWLAIRETTPAGRLPRSLVAFAVIAAILAVIAFALLTFSVAPSSGTGRVSPLFMGLACGIGGTVAGAILVGLFSWVYRNSLATRPAVAGALYGAGAGVAINAGWRLACPVTTPWHTLGAHGAAILAAALLGALAARGLAASRFRVASKISNHEALR